MENLSENKMKTLRSDNEGEFTSNEFKDFCKEAKMKRELTTPYNPQQNEVVERKNRTIMEVVKAMIYDQDTTIFTQKHRGFILLTNILSPFIKKMEFLNYENEFNVL